MYYKIRDYFLSDSSRRGYTFSEGDIEDISVYKTGALIQVYQIEFYISRAGYVCTRLVEGAVIKMLIKYFFNVTDFFISR